MFGVSQVAGVGYHDRGDRPQPRDDLSRIVKLPHMRVAGGEITIRLEKLGYSWIARSSFGTASVEASSKEMRTAYYAERCADRGAGTEAQRSFDMLDRDIGLARP